ncbi:hypothetical protein ACUNV4_19020 [Granulosicoccus sp. 3-233]|uniref:hypothetical protein n=1 Tax=Granulosicoccus sp. 3-233 TaxID=3417969 RepID=UPI003D359231
MMKTSRKVLLTGIDGLCLASVVGILYSLALPGAFPESMSDGLRSILVPTPNIQADARDQADCLWLQARNHGFYGIQHHAIAGNTTADEDLLWQAFLDSTGERECGSPLTGMSELMPALLASLPEADRHFMNPAKEPETL